jgi:3D (Asp-Asp-Asp) domain-containing protein
MGIVSIVATLPILGSLNFGTPALVGEPANTNTKTEFVVMENVEIKDGFIIKKDSLNNGPVNSDDYVPIKSEEEIKNEQIIEKWKEKQGNLASNLPQKKFIINASAYTAAADECGKSDGITSSGIKVGSSRTLACPPQYPFGTKIQIEGVGTLICEDRGGAIKGNHFDIYVETKTEAFAFGRQHLIAEIVD